MTTRDHLDEANRLGHATPEVIARMIDQPSVDAAIKHLEATLVEVKALRGVPDDLSTI
jgi:hypothetical protein